MGGCQGLGSPGSLLRVSKSHCLRGRRARELQYVASRSKSLIDVEWLPQGHDTPTKWATGDTKNTDAVPEAQYDVLVLGYGLCSSILVGLRAMHTRLVIPRAHDCITLFLGSRKRHETCFSKNPRGIPHSKSWTESCDNVRSANHRDRRLTLHQKP